MTIHQVAHGGWRAVKKFHVFIWLSFHFFLLFTAPVFAPQIKPELNGVCKSTHLVLCASMLRVFCVDFENREGRGEVGGWGGVRTVAASGLWEAD